MIEVIYREDVSEDTIHEPRNVKQIGSVDPKYRIYIEDTVLTEIRRTPAGENEVHFGVLLGELKRAAGTTYLFIRGMVRAEKNELQGHGGKLDGEKTNGEKTGKCGRKNDEKGDEKTDGKIGARSDGGRIGSKAIALERLTRDRISGRSGASDGAEQDGGRRQACETDGVEKTEGESKTYRERNLKKEQEPSCGWDTEKEQETIGGWNREKEQDATDGREREKEQKPFYGWNTKKEQNSSGGWAMEKESETPGECGSEEEQNREKTHACNTETEQNREKKTEWGTEQDPEKKTEWDMEADTADTEKRKRPLIELDGEAWSRLYEDINHYFPNMEILGWYASFAFLNVPEFDLCRQIQYTHFSGADKVLLLCDRTEREENFYRPDGLELRQTEGYFSFYEKNDAMQTYQQEKGAPAANPGETSHADGNQNRTLRQGTVGDAPARKWNLSAASILVTAALLAAVLLVNHYNRSMKEESANLADGTAGETGTSVVAVAVDGAVSDPGGDGAAADDSAGADGNSEGVDGNSADAGGESGNDGDGSNGSEADGSNGDAGGVNGNNGDGSDGSGADGNSAGADGNSDGADGNSDEADGNSGENGNDGNGSGGSGADGDTAGANENSAGADGSNADASGENENDGNGSDSSGADGNNVGTNGSTAGADANSSGAGENGSDADGSVSGSESTAGSGSQSESGSASEDETVQTGSRVSARYYTVKNGETLYSICMDVYKTSAMVEIVRVLNGIGEDYVIQEGQKIILP